MAQTKIANPNKRWRLLWENTNLESSFAAQTVSLDLQNYDIIMVQLLRSQGGDLQLSAEAMGFIGNIVGACGFADVSGHLAKRTTIFEEDGVTFQDAIRFNSYGSGTVDNTLMIPYRIYGHT